MNDFHKARVALVHDWLTSFGGAERVVAVWRTIFPKAPIHTLIYNRRVLGSIFPPESVIPSRLQKWPFVHRYYRKLLSFMPRAFEEFDLSGYDMVLSSSSSCAKGVLTSSSTFHASYIHTPMRYAWDLYPEYLRNSGPLTRFAMRRFMPGIRLWDQSTANRVDAFLCNSQEVARRIQKVYRRKAVVVHPPIDTEIFTPSDPSEPPKKGSDLGAPYLMVGRLIPYKRMDIAIRACTQTGKPLNIIGDGPQRRYLQSIAGPTVRFLGFQTEEAVRNAYRECKAFLFPGFEDFGMTPLEVQACGRPVLAYGKGGALETIVPEKTGLFFNNQSVESLLETMEKFESQSWDPSLIRKHSERFDTKNHVKKLLETLDEKWKKFHW